VKFFTWKEYFSSKWEYPADIAVADLLTLFATSFPPVIVPRENFLHCQGVPADR
jgi:hypothetical protein